MPMLLAHASPLDLASPLPCFECKGKGCPRCTDEGWSAKDTGDQTKERRMCFSALAPPDLAEVAALAAEVPLLDGKPVPLPRFQTTKWKKDQIFSPKDDPDRVTIPIRSPSFLHRDPLIQQQKTRVEEIDVSGSPGSFARVIHGVLEPADCVEAIACINEKGFTPALVNIGGGKQQLLPYTRDGHRVTSDSPEIVDWLLEVIRPHLPATMQVHGRHPPEDLLELNERCRWLLYTPGQCFAEHFDGNFRKPTGQSSRVTVQLYLNDVPAACGGATTFLVGRSEQRIPCQPMAGSILIFSQDLYHEGSLLEKGLKYTMRTEAMYISEKAKAECQAVAPWNSTASKEKKGC